MFYLASLQVPVSLFCSISSELHFLVLTKPRRGLSISLKGEPAYPFWWLMNFLRYKTPLPGVEGTALILLMARKYCIESLVNMCCRVSHV